MYQNKSTIQVSPNLLANFNPFDILEPEKSDTNGLRVEKLIDVDNSAPDFDIDPSLLDQKPHYDLVDLYQNFYVTPQLVKLKNKDTCGCNNNPSSSSNNDDLNETAANGPKVEILIDIDDGNNICKFNDIDFKIFLDKYESGDKIAPQHDISDGTTKTKGSKDEDEDTDPEDLIQEVLYQKSIEKRYMDDVNSGRDENTNNLEHKIYIPVESLKPKVLKSPPIDLLALKNSRSNGNNNSLEQNMPNGSKQDNPEIDLIKEFYLKLNNDYINEINVNKIENNSKIEGQIKNVVNFKVIPIKKDEKVYKRRHVLKPESQTCKFTKGPDLEEKMIVLPQMMARIYDRKAYLENKSSFKKVLILDDGRNESKMKERTSKYTKREDYMLSNLKEVMKNAKINQEERSTGSNIEKIENTSVKKDEKQCCQCSYTKSSVKEIHSSSNSTKSYVRDINSDSDYGEVNPIIVMEDCRQERIKALRMGQMLRKLVMEGEKEQGIHPHTLQPQTVRTVRHHGVPIQRKYLK